MGLTEKQLKELKEDLLSMKKNLEEQAELKDTQDLDTDEVSFGDNHLAEYATEYVDKQTRIAERNLNEEHLKEVKEALDRIEKGSYGICVDTGKAIPFERLKAIPYAKRTVEAKEKHKNLPPANKAEDTTRLVDSEGEIDDSRDRTLERIKEEHD